jgi:uncharacterized protein YeaO (DUF488 family)
MLYTTYFTKMDKIPDDCIKLIITRFPPKWLDVSKYPNTYIAKELSPSQELLLKYKKDNNWDEYVIQFYEEMNYRKDMVNMLKKLSNILNKGIDIYLICYEKDYTHCHRSLLGQYFEEEGIEWKEV